MLRCLMLFIFFLGFFISSLILLPVTWIVGKINPLKADHLSLHIVQGFLMMVGVFAGMNLTVKGIENIPEGEPALYVGNHRSFFDIVAIYPLMPDLTSFVAKQSLLKVPFIGAWLRRVKGLGLNRDNNREALKTILKGIDYLKADTSVVIFPEGTRCKEPEGNLLPFKEGSFKLAEKSKRKIVPVAITGTSKLFEDHFPLVYSSDVIVEFLPPIDTAAMSREDMKGIGERVERQIREAIRENIAS